MNKMRNLCKESFTDALKQRNLEKIRAFPKADLHNHFVLGGSRQYLRKMTGIKIEPVKTPILSMDEMHGTGKISEKNSRHQK